MKKPTLSSAGTVCALGLLLAAVSFVASAGLVQPEEAAENTLGSEPAPPAGQTYTGSKKCASCHFEQFLVWRKDKHAKAFDVLPAKYKTDADCLKCHTTGHGEPTGFQSPDDTHLAGISCEACHGPGSKHEEICKPFARAKKLSEDQEKAARDSIYLMRPDNVCAKCHLAKAHKKHPQYDKE